MTFLAILLGLTFPRLLSAILWFFTGWFVGVFHTRIWPILGFVFLSTTMLWYSAVGKWYGGEWTAWRITFLVGPSSSTSGAAATR
jgi:hypothetical protein